MWPSHEGKHQAMPQLHSSWCSCSCKAQGTEWIGRETFPRASKTLHSQPALSDGSCWHWGECRDGRGGHG